MQSSKNETIHLYKPIGQTPLETINDFKNSSTDYSNSKLAYAGRLDPMANGDLLVLVDEACEKRDEYQLYNKEYIFTFVLGVATDTYDLFGRITVNSVHQAQSLSKNVLVEKMTIPTGSFLQTLPAYSSYRVGGKPLFWWANQNLLHTITIPQKQVHIFSSQIVFTKTIQLARIKTKVNFLLSSISGDFRYEQIQNDWNTLFSKFGTETALPYCCIRIQVSSGTYIRSIVNQIGKELGVGATAVRIFRQRIYHKVS